MCDDKLKIGDHVLYRGAWGMAPARIAEVTELTLTEAARIKYGSTVEVVDWCAVEADCVLVGLSDGHWCYGSQIVRKLTEKDGSATPEEIELREKVAGYGRHVRI